MPVVHRARAGNRLARAVSQKPEAVLMVKAPMQRGCDRSSDPCAFLLLDCLGIALVGGCFDVRAIT